MGQLRPAQKRFQKNRNKPNEERKNKQMKTMKKALALVLALAIVMSLGISAFAASGANIVITNDATTSHMTLADQEFKAYKVFNLSTSGDGDSKKYTYTVADEFADFYFPENETGNTGSKLIDYITNNNSGDSKLATAAQQNAFAAAVVKFAKGEAPYTGNSVIAKDGVLSGAGSNAEKVTFSGLDVGYYVVTGSAKNGTEVLVASTTLRNTDVEQEINVKVQAPSVEKTVTDDNANVPQTGVSAQVGDVLDFTLTSAVPNTFGYEKYRFGYHDELSEGLEYIKDASSISATVNGNSCTVQVGDNDVPGANVFVVFGTTLAGKSCMDVYFGAEDGSSHDALPLFTAGTKGNVVFNYQTKVTDKAFATVRDNNDVYPVFSRDPSNWEDGTTDKVPHDKVYVHDFNLGVVKTEKDAASPTYLAGAEFALYKETVSGEKLYYQVADKKVNWNGPYADGAAARDNNKADIRTTQASDGKFTEDFKGLEDGTYYLEEIKAPEGYNKLDNAIKVTIKSTLNDDGTLNKVEFTYSLEDDQVGISEVTKEGTVGSTTVSYDIPVENASGNALPETGGVGTTIFYTVGALMMAGALVLLITKKKMSVN